MTPDMHNSHMKYFDDNELLKTAKAFHIERLTVFYSKFICGITIIYKLDGKNWTVEHLGSATQDAVLFEKLVLEEFEHMEYI